MSHSLENPNESDKHLTTWRLAVSLGLGCHFPLALTCLGISHNLTLDVNTDTNIRLSIYSENPMLMGGLPLPAGYLHLKPCDS